jgi:S1-C subfamily serine protease
MIPLLKLLVVWSVVGLAPVPADPPPDPLGWGYLGVMLTEEGLRFTTIYPNSPAAKAGLQVGDELVAVGRRKPRSQLDAILTISDHRPGSVVRLEVRRNGEPKTLFARLAARPADINAPGTRTPVPFPDR